MENIDWALPITLTIEVTGLPKTLESNTQEGESAVGQMMSNPRNPLLTEEEEAPAVADGLMKDIDAPEADTGTSLVRKFLDEWRERLTAAHEEDTRKYPKAELTDEGINITHYVDAGEDLRETMAYWMADELGAEFAKKLETKRAEKTIEEIMRGKETEFIDIPEEWNDTPMLRFRFIEKDDD